MQKNNINLINILINFNLTNKTNIKNSLFKCKMVIIIINF